MREPAPLRACRIEAGKGDLPYMCCFYPYISYRALRAPFIYCFIFALLPAFRRSHPSTNLVLGPLSPLLGWVLSCHCRLLDLPGREQSFHTYVSFERDADQTHHTTAKHILVVWA